MSVYRCPDCGYFHVGHTHGMTRQFFRDIRTEENLQPDEFDDKPTYPGYTTLSHLSFGKNLIISMRSRRHPDHIYMAWEKVRPGQTPFSVPDRSDIREVTCDKDIHAFISDHASYILQTEPQRAHKLHMETLTALG